MHETQGDLFGDFENRSKSKNILNIESQFEILWRTYPEKIKGSKKMALKAFIKALKVADLDEMLRAIESIKIQKFEEKANGLSVARWPHLSTWLNQERFNDEVPTRSEIQKYALSLGRKPTDEEIFRRINESCLERNERDLS